MAGKASRSKKRSKPPATKSRRRKRNLVDGPNNNAAVNEKWPVVPKPLQKRLIANGMARIHGYQRVWEVFNLDLEAFWPDNNKGLDDEAFLAAIGCGPSGQPLAAIRSKFGKDAVAVYKRLRPDTYRVSQAKEFVRGGATAEADDDSDEDV